MDSPRSREVDHARPPTETDAQTNVAAREGLGTPATGAASGPPSESKGSAEELYHFSPAKPLPAPYAPVRAPRSFTPVAGIVVERGGKRRRRRERPVADDQESITYDRTPVKVYYTVLALSVVAWIVGFLFYNSSSFGPIWKSLFFVELVVLSILILVLGSRLGRKRHWGSRLAEGLGNFFVGIFDMIVGIRDGIRDSITSGIEGLQGGSDKLAGRFAGKDGKPNFIVRFIQRIIKIIVGIITFVLRVIMFNFNIVRGIWGFVVRIGWRLYNWIVFPVLMLAFRILRWALRVVWRVLRWALKVAWKIVYWFLRWWPIRYITFRLRPGVQEWAGPKVLVFNVVLSEALLAPVKEETRTKAEPYVAEYRYGREVKRAVKLLEKEEEYEALREQYQAYESPHQKRESKRRRKQEAKQAKIDAKEAEKQAKIEAKEDQKRLKEEYKQAKAEGRDPKAEAKAAEKAEKERLRAERAAEKAREPLPDAKGPAAPEVVKAPEPEKKRKRQKGQEDLDPEEAAKLAKMSPKQRQVYEKRKKKEAKVQAKLDKKQAQQDAKAEAKAAKLDAKTEQKAAKAQAKADKAATKAEKKSSHDDGEDADD